MTDDRIELSRRKILASLGTIGAAGVGAGLGTSAYFSDQETFTNNSLVAGELDLHVGWEEHYSDWSDDEDDGLSSVEMVEPGMPANSSRVGLPLNDANTTNTPENGTLITVENVSQARQFLNNTEAGPNSSWANVSSFDPSTVSGDPCQYLASASDQSPVIINLDDVKPGDFGEITFSFATCDNPGYVWLNGGLQSASENGYTEPEEEDPDETGDADSDGEDDTVELLDAVRAAAWYDDGDNLQSGGGGGGSGTADIVFVIDESGSMDNDRDDVEDAINTLLTDLSNLGIDAQFAVVDYQDTVEINQSLTSDEQLITDALANPTSQTGNEKLSKAIYYAATNLTFRNNSKRIYVGITDENDQSSSDEKDDAIAELNATNSAFLGLAETETQISRLLNEVNETEFQSILQAGGTSSAVQSLVEFTGSVVSGEAVFVSGTLREVLNDLSSNLGVALNGDISAEEGGGMSERNCFSASTRHDIGFAWWLPVDHANEIQTDTATFELGFYTEQCRHNDGSGQTPENSTS